VNGWIAVVGKLLDLPGEQVLTYNPDGIVRLWADRDAADTPAALVRYAQSFYRSALRHMATGSNDILLGGI
jgi:hypothetical protein